MKETFLNWASLLPETAKDKSRAQHPVWIVRAPFCAMSIVNDERPSLGNEASEGEKLQRERGNNFEVYWTE